MMHLVENTPAPCLVCGRGNTPKANGERMQFVDLEVHVNWNDEALICEDCGLRIAGLLGTPSPEMVQQYKGEIRELKRELHDAKVQIESMETRAHRLGIRFTPEQEQVA